MKKILIQNLNEIKEQLSTRFDVCDISYAPEECKVSELLKGEFTKSDTALKGELIFMADLSEDEMDEVSAMLKQANLHPIQVAATKHNIQWSIGDLISEVQKEKQLFQKLEELNSLLKSLNNMPHLDLSMEDKLALIQSFSLFQSHDLSLDQVNQAIVKMQEIIKKSQ